MKQTRRFEHAPGSVTAARRFTGEVLQAAPAEARDAASLMVSELASNCVRHTDAGFELTVIYTAGAIRVETIDQGSGEPRVRNPGPTDPHGRGLQIVEMLSDEWGFDYLSGPAKRVWFTLTATAPVVAKCASG